MILHFASSQQAANERQWISSTCPWYTVTLWFCRLMWLQRYCVWFVCVARISLLNSISVLCTGRGHQQQQAGGKGGMRTMGFDGRMKYETGAENVSEADKHHAVVAGKQLKTPSSTQTEQTDMQLLWLLMMMAMVRRRTVMRGEMQDHGLLLPVRGILSHDVPVVAAKLLKLCECVTVC